MLVRNRAILSGDWANSLKISDRILAVDGDRSTQFVSRMIYKAQDKDQIKDLWMSYPLKLAHLVPTGVSEMARKRHSHELWQKILLHEELDLSAAGSPPASLSVLLGAA